MVNWDFAPSMYDYHAFDESGFGYWYCYKPELQNDKWEKRRNSFMISMQENKGVCWKQSLEKRIKNG